LKVLMYKIGQLIGASATIFIASWLLCFPHYEPNPIIRWFEVLGSYLAAGILILDIIDIHPRED